MAGAIAVRAMLAGMALAADVSLTRADGRVVIRVGATPLFDYAANDVGMRKLAAVTLPELGFTARRVAAVRGLFEYAVIVGERDASPVPGARRSTGGGHPSAGCSAISVPADPAAAAGWFANRASDYGGRPPPGTGLPRALVTTAVHP